MWKSCFILLIGLLHLSSSQAQDNAVILVYHHVGNDTPKSTSVSPEVFLQHMQFLADHHTVLPLKTIIDKLQAKEPLPDKAVAITFDDGYKNIYENAHPILRKFGFPYTVFVNPALIGTVNYQLDWQQVEIMNKQNVTFANHGNAHLHSLKIETGETLSAWLNRITDNVIEAEAMLRIKVGYSLKYFAYPYGEFNQTFKQKLLELGYTGFAQHSGAIASFSDFGALPRFPSAGIYSNLNTLKVKLNSLAMPIEKVMPSEPELSANTESVAFSFHVNTQDLAAPQISCFKGGSKLKNDVSGQQIAISAVRIAKAGRHRINCTAPSKQHRGRFYWYSHPFFVPTKEGHWLD